MHKVYFCKSPLSLSCYLLLDQELRVKDDPQLCPSLEWGSTTPLVQAKMDDPQRQRALRAHSFSVLFGLSQNVLLPINTCTASRHLSKEI